MSSGKIKIDLFIKKIGCENLNPNNSEKNGESEPNY